MPAMPVDKILRGLKRFQKKVYPKHRELFHKLALQQRPTALFITCADSRIDPCLLTQTKPGELFLVPGDRKHRAALSGVDWRRFRDD